MFQRPLLIALFFFLTACQAFSPLAPGSIDPVTGLRVKSTVSRGAFKVLVEPSEKFGEEVPNQLRDMAAGLATALNDKYVFPKGDVNAVFMDCGFANAFYKPATSTIGMCYEMYRTLQQRFDTQDSLEVFRFIFLHELGHALIDQFDLPVIGGEEDAADALATVLLIEGGEASRAAVLAGVNFFDLYRSGFSNNWAADHAVGPQRMFNLVCWGAGGEEGVLENRTIRSLYREAVRSGRDCAREYQKQRQSVNELLSPYVKS